MKLIKVLCLITVASGCGHQIERDYSITAVPFTEVKLRDNLFSPRIDKNSRVTIPYAFKKYQELGIVKNFELAGGSSTGEQCGNYPFDETDVYKTIEGASYQQRVQHDDELAIYLDQLVTKIRDGQEDDGYLYTARTNHAERFLDWMGKSRWANLGRSHELYNAGHLYEAALAHFQATGKRTLLDVAIKNADLVAATFGPDGIHHPPGHQEIEIGLVKLYRLTGNNKYLSLARFFLDQRGVPGQGRVLLGEYAQDHKPIIEQDEAVGHAVRALYMYSSMADIVALTGDRKYEEALKRLWHNVVGKKLHITGGLGSVGMGESFGKNYELPNMSAYNETCASIANIYWNYRMFLLYGEAKYLDVLEKTLYNALLAGVSLQGNTFFYDNPLASRGQHERSDWLYCSCCISNLTRFFPAMPQYVYAKTDAAIFVNLFIQSSMQTVINGHEVRITQETDYPWDGTVTISVASQKPSDFLLQVRIPGWARNQPVPGDLYQFQDSNEDSFTVSVNGKPVNAELVKGFLQLRRTWKKGDRLELQLPMAIRRVVANKKVEENVNKVGLQRGPLIYCAEGVDQESHHVLNLVLPDEADLSAEFQAEMLGGVVGIRGKAYGTRFRKDGSIVKDWQAFSAVPYFAWAHRGRGEMAVWLATDISASEPLYGPTLASTGKVSSSGGINAFALNDEKYPKKSGSTSIQAFIWSAGKDTVWVQYDFAQPQEVSQVQVYWLDRRGAFSVPKSWGVLARFNGDWRPVWNYGRKWGTESDRFNQVLFETVKTTSVRLEAQLEPNSKSGIFEWRIF